MPLPYFLKNICLILFCLNSISGLAQADVFEQEIPLSKGDYYADSLISAVETRTKTKLSFAGKSFESQKINIPSKNPTVGFILQLLFNPENFEYFIKTDKILIRRKRQIKVKGEMTISGFVEDKNSGERLISADIYIPGTTYGTSTNTFGFFSLSIPIRDSVWIISKLIGYKPEFQLLNRSSSLVLNILLEPEQEVLNEITIVAEEGAISTTTMGNVKLNADQIKDMPAFMGEVDVLKAVQFLAGIQTTNEGSVNYIVRGGNPDQNLILLDGVPVYNVSHLFGFFSVFNIDAIKHVELTKGGFPAQFGGRLSSVLEVNMKEGNLKEFHGSGGIGLLAANLTLEGPIVKDKASFMISGRRTYSDLIYRPILKEEGLDAGYYFLDLNAKVNWKISEKDRLYLSFYNGFDKAFSDEIGESIFNSEIKWGNYTSALRWNHLFSNKLFGNLTATYSRYNFKIGSFNQFDTVSSAINYFSRITDYGIRYDLDYLLSAKHTLKAGVNYTYHNFRPGALNISLNASGISDIDSLINLAEHTFAHDLSLYIEDTWNLNQRTKLNGGLHFANYLVNGKYYYSFQPRVSGRFLMHKNWALKASYSYMEQYIHLLTNSSIGLPTDLWVSSTKNIKPQTSHQVAIGSTLMFGENKWEFTNELFYKKLGGLIEYKPITSFAPASNWEDQVLSGGSGFAKGWEMFLRYSSVKTSGWIAYTLSKSERRFDELNNGIAFPFKYDRRHDLKVVFNHNFTKKFSLGCTWVFNNGINATIPVSTYVDLNGNKIIKNSSRNAFKYPNYHRLDLALNWKKKTSWGERTWGISIYNAYNRRNPFLLYFDVIDDKRQGYQVSIFPFLPTFNYNFRF